jgi:hypothetical protein
MIDDLYHGKIPNSYTVLEIWHDHELLVVKHSNPARYITFDNSNNNKNTNNPKHSVSKATDPSTEGNELGKAKEDRQLSARSTAQ